ncbi:MAG: hypothetical protein WCP16_22850 [Pseudanabaena sp. ELA645]|jgi:hypothetical protein
MKLIKQRSPLYAIGYWLEVFNIFTENMNYLVSVWSDRMKAEEVYTQLESANFPMESISILGKGYKTAEEFGFIDPIEIGRKQAFSMSYWLVPFGFLSGVGFSLVTDLQTFAWAGAIGNHAIGGLLGAFGGAMGSIFVGGGVGVATSSDSVPMRNRLEEGKYLIIVQGADNVVVRANQIMRPLRPENIHGYVAP